MSLLSINLKYSFNRIKNTLYTILLSICFVFVNSAFAISNSSSSISQNTEVYLITTDWIEHSTELIFNPRTNKYYTGKTESSNSSLVLSQPFPNPDSDGDGIEDAIDIDDDNDGILDDDEKACTSVPNSSNSFNGSGTYTLTGDSGGLTIDILQLDNSFNMNINGTLLVPTQVQFDLGHYNSSGGQSLVRFVSDGELMNSVHGISSASPNDVSVKLVIDPNGEVSLYGSKTPGGALELMYIQTGDPQFNTISLNESGNNTVQITQMSYGPTYINGGYYFSELVCSDQDTNNNSVVDRLDLDSDGDGCPDALEGAGTFTSSDLDSNNRLSGGVDSNGVPTVASGGQDVGTSQTANPVLVEADHIDLAVSDATYSSYTENVVFTISNAIANFTYELVDASGTSFSPPVMATQGANTGDLDLTLSYANVPTDSSSPTFKVVAGGSNACTVTLTAEPTLSPADTDNDGTPDITDLDDDGDGIPDSVEDGSGYLSDLSIWLDANDAASITIDNYYTADEWRDKSGNKRHVSNQVGDPQTGLRTINGLNVIDFTSSRMATSSIASWLNNTSYTIIAVTQFDNNTNHFMGTEGNGNNQIMHHGYTGSSWTLSQFGGGNGTSWSTSLSSTTPVLSVTTAAHPTYEAWINGTSLGINTSTYSIQLSATGPFNIGRPESDGGWGYYDGTIAEIIIISDEITSVKRQKIEGYLAHKWGLEGNLPSNHPYATSPPPPNNDVDNDGIPNSRDSDSDGDGCPDAQERDGQDIGTSQTANPVLVVADHIDLAVSDVSYSSTVDHAVFTITDAVANITYELVDANGASLNPQVLATQGSSTGDLDLTLLAANVPTGATSTTFKVVAGVSNACTVTLTDEPTLTLVDTDGDGVIDISDLDDDNDGVLDTEEGNNFNVEEISETLPLGLLSNSTGLIRAVDGSADVMAGTQHGVSTTPFNGTNYISFHTDNSGARSESFSIQLSEPLNAGESLNISFQAITLDDGVRAWDNSSKIHIDGGNSFGDDSVNLYITPSTGNNSEGWKNYSFNYEAASTISHITIYNVSDTNAESFVGIDNIIVVTETDTDSDGIPNSLDLDSDGDGCSDALEAGATTNTTADYAFTGAVGANGLVDALETTVDSGVINYTSTFSPNAVSDFLAGCADTDSDGVNDLLDIDDDNDGILDATESPSCYYLANEVAFTNATTSLTNYSTNAAYSFTELYDGVLNNIAAYGADNTSITDETVYELELLFPVELSEIDIVVNYSVFRTGAEFKWQGYNGSTWVDVTGTLTETQAINTTITYTLNSTGTKYYSYRLQGISGATWYNRIYEIVPRVDTATYQSSLHPKDNCSVDTDGDGTYNHLDLDSDGDGCSDSIEGVSPIPASPWSPAEITTSVWLDAADASTITADGNGISQWDDKSGNDHHAVQTNNTYKPAHVQNDLDGKDGVDFYLNKSLRKNTGTQTVGYVIAVLKAENATWNNYHTIFGHRANSRFGGIMQSGNTGFHNGVYPGSVWVDGTSKTVSQSGFSTIDSPHIWSYTPNGNTVKTLTAGYNMGSYDNNNGHGSATHYEVVVLPTIPTDEERQILEGYLAHKWDLAANLPDGHPYKNAAPESTIVGGGSGATCNIFTKPSNNSTSVYNTGDDTNNNGLLDAFEGAEAGTINYTSRYVVYALDNSINACTDSDGDDVGDIFDLDDDNDGVLDTTEGTGDTDNDGTPNHLDTDSDGDGCLDTIEAGTTNNGTTTDANCNGLLDQYEDGVTNTINYTSTYNPYALNNTVNSCVDSDSDGINDVFDIDDDNDGVLDTEEGCQILAYDLTTLTWDTAAAMTVTTANSSTLQGTSTSSWKSALSTKTFSLPLDISFTYSETSTSGQVMVGFAEEDSDLGTSWNTATAFGFFIYNTNSKARYNNTNGGTDTGNSNGKIHRIVIDAAGNLTNTIDGQVTYQQTGLSTGEYKLYIAHNGGTNKPLENVALKTANYPLSCDLDTDNDGTPNGLDTDSDGDGCSDTTEAGTSDDNSETDANTNGLLDQYEDGTTGTINYTSTYSAYALNDAINACTDNDDDGVNDVFDLDDDNDGILDTVELLSIDAALWLDASDPSSITKDSNGLVSQWNDKSGNEHHATQSTESLKPISGTATINGNNALKFDGTDDRLENSSLTTGQPFSIFAVIKDDISSGSFRTWWSGDSGGNRSFLQNNNGNNRSMWADSYLYNGSSTTNNEIWTAEFNGSSSVLYVDGTPGTTGNVGNNSINGFWIGEENGSSYPNWNGLIGEILIFDAILSEADRQKIEGYLAHKWGLAANLPADHPYKNVIPTSDLDGDNIPNSRDLDSDGDGIPDNI
ncbi:MAG: hypothetical protein ACPH3L_05250, partial [Flavobacteriaceae bacterium]